MQIHPIDKFIQIHHTYLHWDQDKSAITRHSNTLVPWIEPNGENWSPSQKQEKI